jgi:hypothetical protein
MEQKKVRIINNTTGEVRFVMPHIADNEKRLKQYGFVKQDFEKKEEKKDQGTITHNGDTITYSKPMVPHDLITTPTAKLEYEFPNNGDEIPAINERSYMTDEEAREKYFELFGKKPGNKKLETILSEIQEKLTI